MFNTTAMEVDLHHDMLCEDSIRTRSKAKLYRELKAELFEDGELGLIENEVYLELKRDKETMLRFLLNIVTQIHRTPKCKREGPEGPVPCCVANYPCPTRSLPWAADQLRNFLSRVQEFQMDIYEHYKVSSVEFYCIQKYLAKLYNIVWDRVCQKIV